MPPVGKLLLNYPPSEFKLVLSDGFPFLGNAEKVVSQDCIQRFNQEFAYLLCGYDLYHFLLTEAGLTLLRQFSLNHS